MCGVCVYGGGHEPTTTPREPDATIGCEQPMAVAAQPATAATTRKAVRMGCLTMWAAMARRKWALKLRSVRVSSSCLTSARAPTEPSASSAALRMNACGLGLLLRKVPTMS